MAAEDDTIRTDDAVGTADGAPDPAVGHDEPGRDEKTRGPEGSESRQLDSARISLLEPGWWKQLSETQEPDDVAKAWAPLMFEMLKELEAQAESCAVFIHDPPSGRLRVAASWPENRLPGNALLVAAETAVAQGSGVVRGAFPGGPAGNTADGQGGLVSTATPLMVNGFALGAVGAEIRPAGRPAMVAAMRRLQWGAAWMRDVLRAQRSDADAKRFDHAVSALHIVVAVAEWQEFPTAARSAATDLATRFDCDRVSIGFRRFGRCRVRAISHSAQFGKRMNLVQMLGAAMDEAIDQQAMVHFPADRSEEVLSVHRQEILARAHGAGHVLTAPLFAVDRYVGAIVFERPTDKPFTQDDVDMLEATATVLAPVLNEKRRNDRWLITKAGEAVATQFTRLVGPGRLARKAVVAALIAITVFFWFARMDYRITADAAVEGIVQRAVVAPLDGFIAEAPVRAGDEVEKGDVLVRLDDRDLALERLRLVTLRQRQQLEFDRAISERNRAETSIRQTQIAQADAQIQLIDEQLARTVARAPFNGLVVVGDLSQSIGAAVARGEPLMTVAPLDAYRIAIKVDERRISDVKLGQTGTLLVTALPLSPLEIRVDKITPVAEYADGATTFRVEALLTGDTSKLRPGMEGVVKIDVDERRVFTIWTQPLVDWFRVWLWRWAPF